MPLIEPYDSWLALEARAATETNPRYKALLTQVRDHMEYEIKGDLEPLMATLTAAPIYHFWGNAPNVIEGFEAVEAFYTGMIATGTQQFEVVVERIVVDDNTVITEGRVKQVYQGGGLLRMGLTSANDVELAEAGLYLTDTQLITVWPADPDGKLLGEDIYFGQDPFTTLTAIDQADLPDYYRLGGAS